MLKYLKNLQLGQQLLWSYLLWYLSISFIYFDPCLQLWLSSLGIALIIGAALVISTTCWPVNMRTLDKWQTMRLFLIPFCVSSYSSLIKDQDFFLIFPPDLKTNLLALSVISSFLLISYGLKKFPPNA